MAKLKKSWKEILHQKKDLPKIIEIDEKMSKRWGTGTCVIPAPVEADEVESLRIGPGGVFDEKLQLQCSVEIMTGVEHF